MEKPYAEYTATFRKDAIVAFSEVALDLKTPEVREIIMRSVPAQGIQLPRICIEFGLTRDVPKAEAQELLGPLASRLASRITQAFMIPLTTPQMRRLCLTTGESFLSLAGGSASSSTLLITRDARELSAILTECPASTPASAAFERALIARDPVVEFWQLWEAWHLFIETVPQRSNGKRARGSRMATSEVPADVWRADDFADVLEAVKRAFARGERLDEVTVRVESVLGDFRRIVRDAVCTTSEPQVSSVRRGIA